MPNTRENAPLRLGTFEAIAMPLREMFLRKKTLQCAFHFPREMSGVSVSTFHFVHDFSLMLIIAGFAAILSKSFKIPLLLGYIIGGVVLNIPIAGESLIHSPELIHQLSELGIAFLMFYAGLEFDLGKLRQLFSSVTLALFFQTFAMILLGRIVAPLLGWEGLSGLFLGGLLAISSTMITLPILSEQKALKSNFAQLSIGILVFEDILAIMLLVILSGISITGHFAWDAIGRVTFLVGTFVVGVFFVGRMLAPFIIKLLLKFNSEEVITVVVIAFLLGIGLLAECAKFSIALGAFLAGAIFSKSQLAATIEHHIQPIQTLFSAVFFTSIGLTIHLANLWNHIASICVLTLLVFVLKSFSCFLGLFLSGQNGEDSLKSALSKAQIGEFSFVIASLGVSLHVVDKALLDIAVGISIGSIVCASLCSSKASKIYASLLRCLPKTLVELSDIYHSILVLIRGRMVQNRLLGMATRPLLYIIINTFLFAALLSITSFSMKILARIDLLIPWIKWVNAVIWGGVAILSLPLFVPTVKQINLLFLAFIDNSLHRGKENSDHREMSARVGAIFQSIIFAILLLIFGGTFLSVSSPHLPHGSTLIAFIFLLTFSAIIFGRRVSQLNSKIEHYFISTFNRDVESQLERQRKQMLQKFRANLAHTIDMREVIIAKDSVACGSRVDELSLRKKFSVTIVAIRREGFTEFSPHPHIPLFPNDTLIIVGKSDGLTAAITYLESSANNGHIFKGQSEEFEMKQLCIPIHHEFTGKTLVECNLRNDYAINVVGIQRNGHDIDSPAGNEVLQPNDILIVVGGKSAVINFHDKLGKCHG
ncbi:MAG: cation:proton antiporter [Puniceicoccales bacterium]|nr:cation:proton antiporter [Puniceicoccales bacterium]